MNLNDEQPTEHSVSENEQVRYFNIRFTPFQGTVVAVFGQQCWVVKPEMRTVDRVHVTNIVDYEGMKSYFKQEWSHDFERIDDMQLGFTDNSAEVHKKVQGYVRALLLILPRGFDRNSIVP